MMKVPFVAILFLLVCHAAALAESASGKPVKWPAQPEIDLPEAITRLLPPISDPNVKKCLGEGVGPQTCLREISVSFLKHRVTLTPDCCKMIQKLNGDCHWTVFGRFPNKHFHAAVMNQCAAAVAAPSLKA